MLNFELRCKCGKMMKFSDGTAYGSHGVDTENCRDPYFYCECENEVDFFETSPNSESSGTHPTVNQQLKAEIAYMANQLETCYYNNLFDLLPEYVNKLRQLSAV